MQKVCFTSWGKTKYKQKLVTTTSGHPGTFIKAIVEAEALELLGQHCLFETSKEISVEGQTLDVIRLRSPWKK